MAQKDTYYGCFGTVKGKMNPKKERVWEIKASSVEGAIKSIKTSAQSNYRDDHKNATLFDERGYVVGWVFRNYGQMIFVGRYLLQDIGLIPKSRK